MDGGIFIKGLVIGLAIAAPVGPIGVLCIRRTLTDGRAVGLSTGLGAATADSFYAAVAAFGLVSISGFLVENQGLLRLVGGAFLCYLGVRTFLASPAASTLSSSRVGLGNAYASTFFLTITNPATIVSFAAVFAGLGLAGARGDFAVALLLVTGVFLGSALWWLFLSSVVGLFRTRVTSGALQWVNRLSGTILLVFGLVALASLLS